MSRMCTVVAVEEEIGTSSRRRSHAFVRAPVAIIGIVALTASQVFAQAAPPLPFNGPVSVGPLSVELRMANRDASVDTSTITPSLTTSPGDIVFVSTRDGNPEIYSVKADGTNLTRLTNNPANDDAPVWSPDGKRIAFASDRDGSWEIYVMNADGTNVVRRTFSASYSGDPCWSPDGNRIVYSTLSNGSLNIWTVSPDSGSPALLLEMPGYDAHPALSPDGSRLAVTSDWYAYDFVYDVFIANADGTGWTGLTGDIFDHVDYVRPSWSPDSAKLAVTLTQTTGVDQYITQLGVMNADGTGLTPLISAVTSTKSSWSPDGTTIAFTSGSPGALRISWVSATDGSKSGTIVTNGYSPDWSPRSDPFLPKLVAAFEYACNGMTCGFDGSASSGGDGAITTWAWDFGDGSTGAGVTTSHDYAAAGSYPVRLTVTDTNGTTSTQTENVIIVQSPVAPDPPTDLVVASVSGNTVTLAWKAPASGTPTGYVLEGGLSPGDVLASIPTGSTATSFTFTAPSGVFFARLHALSGNLRSTGSNEIRLVVNAPLPSAPAALLGLVNGSTLALSWTNTFLGGAPTALQLNVTGALTATIPLGVSDTVSFNDVPGGTYTFTLTASNAAGASPPSNPVTLTFPGSCSVAPGVPTYFAVTKSGHSLTLTWNPPVSGTAATHYVIHASGAVTGSLPTSSRSLSGTVGPGTYSLSVVAANACGTSAPSDVITITVP